MRHAAAGIATAALPLGFKGRNWAQALAVDLQQGLPHIGAIFDRRSRRRLMSRIEGWRTVSEAIWHQRLPKSTDLLQRATRMDFENFLPEDVLTKVDRASMLASLEIRSPLLDYRIIEFAFGRIPSSLKATFDETKILLKRLALKRLPPAFDPHRKQGFSIPLGTWLRSGPWREFFEDTLRGARSRTFDSRFVNSLLHGQLKGRNNHERLFALVMFELWRRDYSVSL
jgi:asparagine synthase (glutamine-hydrolysing)